MSISSNHFIHLCTIPIDSNSTPSLDQPLNFADFNFSVSDFSAIYALLDQKSREKLSKSAVSFDSQTKSIKVNNRKFFDSLEEVNINLVEDIFKHFTNRTYLLK